MQRYHHLPAVPGFARLGEAPRSRHSSATVTGSELPPPRGPVFHLADNNERAAAHRQDPRMRIARKHSVDGVQALQKRGAAVAEIAWREMIAKVITGVQFKNGVEVQKDVRQEIAA